VIRDEMEQTRANLADKLGALEEQVRETVSTASETVTSTVEGVKEVVSNVSETVGSVTETLNFPKQIEQHPWIAVGVAVAAGFAAAQLFGGSRQVVVTGSQPTPQPEPKPQPASQPRYQAASAPSTSSSGPSLLSQAASMLPSFDKLMPDLSSKIPAFETLAPELKKLGDTVVEGMGALAVGGVMNIVRELVAGALPDSWKGEITKLVDDVTQQLGGKPLSQKQQEGEQKPSSDKPADGQNAQPRPNEQAQGNQGGQRNRREPQHGQLVGQG